MKKLAFLCLFLFLISQFMFFYVMADEDSTIPNEPLNLEGNINICSTLDAESPLLGTNKIIDNAKAAILYEVNSDTLMYALNPDDKMYPASIVKLLTVYLAAEKGNLSDTVTIKQSMLSNLPVDAVSAKLVADEVLTLEELLYCTLVGSANDAAVAVAEHISGSHSEFVKLMNEYAQQLGCIDTHFTNAHGLHDPNQYTTARDVARILSVALKNDIFYTVFSAKKHTVPATNKSQERFLESNNSMLDSTSKLYYDNRVIGGRTGVTNDGRRCIATAAQNQNGMLLISVVMGSETIYQEDGYSAISVGGYQETTKLFDAGFTGNKCVQILYENQALKQLKVEDGMNDVVIGPTASVSAILPEAANLSDLSMRYTDTVLKAPVDAGQKITDVQIWYGNMCVAQTELYSLNAVQNAQSNDDLSEQNNNTPWLILGIVIGVIAVFPVSLLLLRLYRKLGLQRKINRNRQYRRSRRRTK